MTTDSAAATDSATATRTRLIMTGGFLGAGKTTLLLRLGEWLTSRGLRVGLVTNDQAGGLVDTSLGRAHDLAVEEIAGGCFCCRFSSLLEAAEALGREQAAELPNVWKNKATKFPEKSRGRATHTPWNG